MTSRSTALALAAGLGLLASVASADAEREYLGEAYVKMGRLEEARRVLDRLRPLDAARARELAEEISKAR